MVCTTSKSFLYRRNLLLEYENPLNDSIVRNLRILENLYLEQYGMYQENERQPKKTIRILVKKKSYNMYSIRKNILFLQEDEVYAQALNKYYGEKCMYYCFKKVAIFYF